MQGNKSPEIREVLRVSASVQCVRVLRVGCDVVITVKQWLVPGRIPWERTKVCFQSESFDPLLRKFELFCPYFRDASNLTEIERETNPFMV